MSDDIDRRAEPCPTCQGRSRETTDMVCMTCGRDYMPDDGSDVSAPGLGWKRLMGLWREQCKQTERERDEWEQRARDNGTRGQEDHERAARAEAEVETLQRDNRLLFALMRPDDPEHDDAVERILRERDEARAALARVDALADHFERHYGPSLGCEIRNAIAGSAS